MTAARLAQCYPHRLIGIILADHRLHVVRTIAKAGAHFEAPVARGRVYA
jgi:hypothetical protein